MEKKNVVYEGSKFTVEWYFNSNGRSLAQEFFLELTVAQRDKLLFLVRLLADKGKIFNKEKFMHEGDQIYALKSDQARFLCFFFEGSKIIITNGFIKKQNKIPLRELEKALVSRDDFKTRQWEGTWYD